MTFSLSRCAYGLKRLSEKGNGLRKPFSSILGELPVSVEQKDENRILALVMDEWNYFKLMGEGGCESIRDGP